MALGRDCRLSSETYQEAVGRGIMAAGIDVTDIGLCATPMLYFAIRHFGTDGGVMVTGSHNPPDFNGFKICIGPDTIYGEEIQELRRIIEEEAYIAGTGRSAERKSPTIYEDYLFANVEVKPGLPDRSRRRQRRGRFFRPPPAEALRLPGYRHLLRSGRPLPQPLSRSHHPG